MSQTQCDCGSTVKHETDLEVGAQFGPEPPLRFRQNLQVCLEVRLIQAAVLAERVRSGRAAQDPGSSVNWAPHKKNLALLIPEQGFETLDFGQGRFFLRPLPRFGGPCLLFLRLRLLFLRLRLLFLRLRLLYLHPRPFGLGA